MRAQKRINPKKKIFFYGALISVAYLGSCFANPIVTDSADPQSNELTTPQELFPGRDVIAIIKSNQKGPRVVGGRFALRPAEYSIVQQLTPGTMIADHDRPSLAFHPPYLWTFPRWLVFIDSKDARQNIIRREFSGIPLTETTLPHLHKASKLNKPNDLHELLRAGYHLETAPEIRLMWLEHWVGSGADMGEEWERMKSNRDKKLQFDEKDAWTALVIGVAAEGPRAIQILGETAFHSLFLQDPAKGFKSGYHSFQLRRLAKTKLLEASKEPSAALQNLKMVERMINEVPNANINYPALGSFVSGVARRAPASAEIDESLLRLWTPDVPADFASVIFGRLNQRLPNSKVVRLSQGEDLQRWDQEFAERKGELRGLIQSRMEWWWGLDDEEREELLPSRELSEDNRKIRDFVREHGRFPSIDEQRELLFPAEGETEN